MSKTSKKRMRWFASLVRLWCVNWTAVADSRCLYLWHPIPDELFTFYPLIPQIKHLKTYWYVFRSICVVIIVISNDVTVVVVIIDKSTAVVISSGENSAVHCTFTGTAREAQKRQWIERCCVIFSVTFRCRHDKLRLSNQRTEPAYITMYVYKHVYVRYSFALSGLRMSHLNGVSNVGKAAIHFDQYKLF